MPGSFNKDQLYARPITELVDFSFDEKTVAVFPDMINRSVPGYSLMQSLTGLIACQFVARNSRVYDLGCSLGASSLAILNSVEHSDYELVLVDQSQPMLERCRQIMQDNESNVSVSFQRDDVSNIEINNASLVMLHLVLQFLPIKNRQMLLDKIYAGLLTGGSLLISEKIESETAQQKQTIDQLYTEFKKRSGYSDLEISQKRRALENVMQIESTNVLVKRLKQAGFSHIVPVMQALNFTTLLAVK